MYWVEEKKVYVRFLCVCVCASWSNKNDQAENTRELLNDMRQMVLVRAPLIDTSRFTSHAVFLQIRAAHFVFSLKRIRNRSSVSVYFSWCKWSEFEASERERNSKNEKKKHKRI